MIRVKHCLETVSFYLGLGLLLNSFKSNQFFPLLCLIHCIVCSVFTSFVVLEMNKCESMNLSINLNLNSCSPASPQWRSGISDGLPSTLSGIRLVHMLFWSFYFLKSWRDLHFHEHLVGRNFTRLREISSKCSVKAIKNTTLSKIRILSKGFRPMGSNAQVFRPSLIPRHSLLPRCQNKVWERVCASHFQWRHVASIGSLRYGDYGLRTTAGRAFSFVCSTGLSGANIER